MGDEVAGSGKVVSYSLEVWFSPGLAEEMMRREGDKGIFVKGMMPLGLYFRKQACTRVPPLAI